MAENKILALDLGSNSIGATIRNPFEENQFEKATVIRFETGVGKDSTSGQYTVSLAANRTAKRSVRRLYQSRKYKLWAVLEALINDKNNLYCPISEQSLSRWKHYSKEEAKKGNGGRQYPVDDVLFANWIKLDFNNDGIPDYISPYQLRNELATVNLDFSIEETRFKLGRALYHIAQHRGFKSSKIVKTKDDEKDTKSKNEEQSQDETIEQLVGAEKKKQERFYNEVTKLNFTANAENDTVGMIFARIENEGIHHEERKTEGIRIRKELHQYVTRKMLIKEVEHIFNFQGLDFNSIFKKDGKVVSISNSDIFRQRPLRSQKGLVGVCTLENLLIETKDKNGNVRIKQVGKKRCPVSRPEFEEFRAGGFINNIQYKVRNDKNAEWQFLSKELRENLYKEKFFVQKDFEFSAICKWIIGKNEHDNWELNYNPKTNVSACTVSARLQKTLGEDWNKMVSKKDKKGNILQVPYFEDIWHVLFESNDQDFIEGYAKTKLHLDDEQTKQFVNLWFAMPVGYAQLSLKAINNILPFLRDGFIYTDAVLLGKVPEILGETIWNKNKKLITNSLKKDVIESNRYEKRILNIVNTLIAQYKALPPKDRFADNNTAYVVSSRDAKLSEGSAERDDVQIFKACEDGFGNKSWVELPAEEQQNIFNKVTEHYQRFFKKANHKREFYSLPRLGDAMKKFLADNFSDLLYCPNTFKKIEDEKDKCKCEKCARLNQLYHPSMMDIYPKAREDYYKYGNIQKQMVMLGSPKIGAWKNPMALRTLHELKKLLNYYIVTGQVDETTRVVVEVGRELVDTNKRWAYETYKNMREAENKEFATAIAELVKNENANADSNSSDDIDKFRLWYEMLESTEGYEDKNKKFIAVDEDRTYGEVKKKTKGKVKKKQTIEPENEEEKKYYSFNENYFNKISKEVRYKLNKAKDNVLEKYRLWKEQQCFCIYTGNAIKITDLFAPNVIDVEHTIPRSMSFDNSLANKTVCFADFNRNEKKNQIPTALSNYDAIKRRIERWEQKVKDLEVRVEFWKSKSKQASTKDYKDTCIREKHLWLFELDYWRNKVDRFTMKEVKPGFKNSQLKDTQLISKYAFHYLKSYFNKVDVQKGAVTAEFRKIFNIQATGTEKDRSKHSHHAKDAIVLSVIPVAAIRDKMLEIWFKIAEEKQLLESDTEKDKAKIENEIKRLEDELQQLIYQCQLPKGLNNTISKLDEELLINNIARNRSLIPASKRVRFNGKEFIAKGDAIKGQLHKDSFFGAIKLVKKDKDGKWIKNKEGNFEFELIKYVIREDLVYKKNSQSPGFKDLADLEKQIVDKDLFAIIKKQIDNDYNGDFKEALNKGIWIIDRKNNKVNKIRRVRIELGVKEPKEIKSQTYINTKPSKILPDRKHKQLYYAGNGENILCALYQKVIKNKKTGKDEFDRELEIISLKEAADLLRTGLIKKTEDIENNLFRKDKNGNVIINETGNKEKPYAILKPGMKVIFYDEGIDELKKQENETDAEYKKRISYRTYKIVKFTGGRLTFQHHLEARIDKELEKSYPEKQVFMINKKGKEISFGGRGTSGFTEKVSGALKHNEFNNYEPWPKLLYSGVSLNMAIEGKHFEVKPDGEIV